MRDMQSKPDCMIGRKMAPTGGSGKIEHTIGPVVFSTGLGGPLWLKEFDVLIKNAKIVDGTGNPGYRSDLAVRSGRIERIEPDIPGGTGPAR